MAAIAVGDARAGRPFADRFFDGCEIRQSVSRASRSAIATGSDANGNVSARHDEVVQPKRRNSLDRGRRHFRARDHYHPAMDGIWSHLARFLEVANVRISLIEIPTSASPVKCFGEQE